jgi:hypothetical protein
MNLNQLIADITARKWILVAAILVGAVVALMKQGWASAWLAKKLPPAALPYLAVVLGALGMSAAEVAAGKPLGQAIIDGIQSGILAVFGHETLIEGLRGGKELVPSRAPAAPPAPPPAKEAA